MAVRYLLDHEATKADKAAKQAVDVGRAHLKPFGKPPGPGEGKAEFTGKRLNQIVKRL